jgi:hypothetical protein
MGVNYQAYCQTDIGQFKLNRNFDTGDLAEF